jgi:quinol-cytochrome oxidoreductase complex cytochrome b subunit
VNKLGAALWRWFDERLDLAPVVEVLEANLRKPVPAHINWFFTLGSAIAALVGLQIFTGILLLVYYRPGAETAYQSIVQIMEAIPLGGFVRSLHVWGADLIIIFLILHMIRVFVYAGYKKPRELTWIIGVLLFAVMLIFGFTGYLLPWDQLAYWGTVVATEAPASIPVVGPITREFMLGGNEVGDATLGRFFALHVIVLPLGLLVLMSLHLFLIRYQGISSLRRTDEPEPTSDEMRAAGGEPFFPHHVLKDLTTTYLVLGLLVSLAILYPAHLGEPADPLRTPPGIKPEWYFLPAYQLLKYVPEVVGVQIPPLFLGLLILLPLVLDRSPERHPRRRLRAIGIGAGVLALIVLLGLLGHVSETRQTIFGTTYHFDMQGMPHGEGS